VDAFVVAPSTGCRIAHCGAPVPKLESPSAI
jgi:hypothetical protein